MDHFLYRDGQLFVEDVPVSALADSLGTPLYVYSRATLLDHFDRFAAAFAPLDPLICFALKSCGNLAVCRTLAERGAGMDLVSGGELHRVREAGVDPARCVYAGVGKTDAEIDAALHAGVGWFNVESEAEFENLRERTRITGCQARAALRINPDVDPKTHRYTTTGVRETKFGVDLERARAFFSTYAGDGNCQLAGLHLHIGSPVYDVEPYVRSVERAIALMDALAEDSYRVDMLDLGGGFGADYESGRSPSASAYAAAIVPLLEPRVRAGLQIVLEPGRSIAANAGVLVVEVLYLKSSGDRKFVICDAGMNALLRPSHYGAFHFIWPCHVTSSFVPTCRAEDPGLAGLERVDVVGPICESGDFLAENRPLPPVQRGDRLAVFGAGAYGMVMASRYNASPLPAEVLVDGRNATLVRRRETYDDLVAHERGPEAVAYDSSVATSHVVPDRSMQ